MILVIMGDLLPPRWVVDGHVSRWIVNCPSRSRCKISQDGIRTMNHVPSHLPTGFGPLPLHLPTIEVLTRSPTGHTTRASIHTCHMTASSRLTRMTRLEGAYSYPRSLLILQGRYQLYRGFATDLIFVTRHVPPRESQRSRTMISFLPVRRNGPGT